MLPLWTAIRRLLTYRQWLCYHCGALNYTSEVIWSHAKYTLICDRCRYQQSYPDYIRGLFASERSE